MYPHSLPLTLPGCAPQATVHAGKPAPGSLLVWPLIAAIMLLLKVEVTRGVRTGPGATALTRMPESGSIHEGGHCVTA